MKLNRTDRDSLIQELVRNPEKVDEFNTLFNSTDVRRLGGSGYFSSVNSDDFN